MRYVVSSGTRQMHIAVVVRGGTLRPRALCSFQPRHGWLEVSPTRYPNDPLCKRCEGRRWMEHNR